MNTNNLSSNERIALSRFFAIYFFSDTLEDTSDLNEALKDYLNFEQDHSGSTLLAGVSKLRKAPNYSEDDMIELIEKIWGSDGMAKEMNYAYKDVLAEMSEVLSERSKDSGDEKPKPDVFIELVNKYVSAIGEDRAQRIREDYGHGEGLVALENFMNSLAEMKAEIAFTDRHEFSRLAMAYGSSKRSYS